MQRSLLLRKLVRHGRLAQKRGFSSSSSLTESGILSSLGLSSGVNPSCFTGSKWSGSGEIIESLNPSNGRAIAQIQCGGLSEYEESVAAMDAAKREWASLPAPERGQVVARIGEKLKQNKEMLGALISLECGKIIPEGQGEVQEAIDICEFAVGLSRSISGKVIPSERPGHFMIENWNPLSRHLGVITAFNFPCAPYFWNVSLSLMCGNCHFWKGSEVAALSTIACHKIVTDTLDECGYNPSIATCIQGSGPEIGGAIANDPRMELVSFTGSTKVGLAVNKQVSRRFGKVIMECGGNNGAIIMDDADLDIALDSVLFGAVGTAGQRCTTLRRLFLHEKIYDSFLEKLVQRYRSIQIGNPFKEGVLCGPLISEAARQSYLNGIERVKKCSKAELLVGGNQVDGDGFFVEPAIAAVDSGAYFSDECNFVREELFGPLLYGMKIDSFEQAMDLHNRGSNHGLSSSLYTNDMKKVFEWLGPNGSDCGLVNVNIGTSGAEIGGAFGGEKMTGLGRESGSDAWKQYMRRSTATLNYSSSLTLAQGIRFGADEE